MGLAELNNDQVHAYAVYRTAAEAMVKTDVTVEVKSEPRRYRLKVGGWLVQVFSRRSYDELSDSSRMPQRP